MSKLLRCWPVQRSYTIDTWLLILVSFTLPTPIQESTKSHAVEVHQTYSTNPRVHFLKTFSFLATERPKWLTQQIQEVTDCTLWHLMLSSSCCVPKKHPAKSLGGMEWYGKSMQGKNQVASLGSAFLISKLLHRLIAILNKRKITRAQNTDILIFLPVYAVFMSAKY